MLQTQIIVKRPTGETETVLKDGHVTQSIMAAIKEQTAKAGRGEVLSVKNIGKPTRAYSPMCPRCHTVCDGDCTAN